MHQGEVPMRRSNALRVLADEGRKANGRTGWCGRVCLER